jgi:hypothetical protein
MGMVTLSQVSATTASVKMAGFVELDSEIQSTELVVQDAKGNIFANQKFEGESGSWDGSLLSTPKHHLRVIACVTVVNTYNLKTKGCSKLILWVTRGPTIKSAVKSKQYKNTYESIKNFYTVNPFTGFYRGPERHCTEKWMSGVGMAKLLGAIDQCYMWSNVTTQLKFAARSRIMLRDNVVSGPIKLRCPPSEKNNLFSNINVWFFKFN